MSEATQSIVRRAGALALQGGGARLIYPGGALDVRSLVQVDHGLVEGETIEGRPYALLEEQLIGAAGLAGARP